MPRRLVPLLLAISLGAPVWSAAADPLVTTTWEVRRESEELIADLRAKRGEPASLIERVQSALNQHGDSLISAGTVFAPLSNVLYDEMTKAGLGELFVRTYGPLAERRFAEIPSGRGADEALRRLALAFPGTETAKRAWARLADRSWDRGRIAAYLSSAAQAGDPQHDQRKDRFTAAIDLLAVRTGAKLPSSLDLEEMWNLPVETPEVRPAGRRPGTRPTAVRGFTISAPVSDLTAASDGQTLFVFDHLVGRRVGSLQQIGSDLLPTRVSIPAAGPDCFIAIGGQNGGVQLTCVGRDGEVRWSSDSVVEGTVSAFSGPLVIDNLVVFAVLRMNEEGPELRVVARNLTDGEPVWDTFVAKLPLLLHRAMMWDDRGPSRNPPALCLHAGHVMVLSNTGVMAKVTAQGSVERIWTYPSAIANERGDGREPTRGGDLRGDGRWLVATPADADGYSLVMGPQDDSPRRYAGDGCRGEVLSVVDGAALLAGGKQITLLDLPSLAPRWQKAGKEGITDPCGAIGSGRVLVGSRERMSLLDAKTGDILTERRIDPPLHVACNDGMVLLGGREAVVAIGRADAFIADQLAAAERNPADYRPLVALGKLWSAQGDAVKAYDFFLQGLKRGAPGEYAGVAARLVRSQLERDLDSADAFAAGLARLDQLSPFDQQLSAESLFWRGRRAEAAGQPQNAIKSYRELLGKPPLRVTFGIKRDDVLDVQIQSLAQLGLARLGAAPLPSWAAPIPESAPPAAGGLWERPGSRQAAILTAGSLLIGYEGGVLTARKLSDGSEAWRRIPDLRLLGVRLPAAQPGNGDEPGVLVDVLDGTAAAAAGMKSGDLIASFNDRPIRDFHRDLIPAVAECQEGAAFTITVLRDRKSIPITGRLGGELVEAITANTSTVLIWPVFPVRNPKGVGEGMWVAAHDLATGKELWRGSIPPATTERQATRPILTGDDTVICVDGTDLIGLALRDPPDKRERWRLPGLASWLDSAVPISSGALLLVDSVHSQARVIDVATGETLYLLPADGSSGAVLERTDLVVRSPDGKLACWDLSQGRLRWRSDKPMFRALALNGDNVYALNERKQLVVMDRASGQQRRLYGDWAALDETAIVGGRLFANVRRAETGRALVSLALAGGTVLWERQLPRGSEVRSFQASTAGLACVIAEPTQKPTVLCLGNDGAPSAALGLPDDQNIRPIAGGVLISGAKGLSVVNASSVTAPPPVPSVAAPSKESLVATGQEVLPALQWQPVGKAAYAVARVDRGLLLFARLPPEVEAMEIRVGDAGPEIDPLNQSVIFQRHRVARFNDAAEGWRIIGSQKLPAENNVWLCVARLDAPVGRTPGTPVQVRAAVAGVNDGPAAPWWLRRAWRTVADPIQPPAGTPPGPIP